MAPEADKIAQAVAVAMKLSGKYLASHHDAADRVDFGLGRVLALYGLLRLSELQIGVDGYAAVDRLLCSMQLSGIDPESAYPHHRMGGVAGAFRCYQGAYKLGPGGGSVLHSYAEQLGRDGGNPTDARTSPECVIADAPFLAMAAGALRVDRYFEAATALWENLEATLFDSSVGLFHHGACMKNGPAQDDYWARANGYAAASLVDLLRYLPCDHPARPRLRVSLRRLMSRLVGLQGPGGLWRQLLLDEHTAEETSGSALLAYALFTAVAERWVSDDYSAASDRAWQGLLGRIELSGNGNVHGMTATVQPGATHATYAAAPEILNSLEGFGPMMLATAAYYTLARQRVWDRRPITSRTFTRPAPDAVWQYFQALHRMNEEAYNGDGSWGRGTSEDTESTFSVIHRESRTSHPIPRHAADCVMGYLYGNRFTTDPIFVQRAREGLEWLLREQEPEGHWRLWTRRHDGHALHSGCLFDTGIAASALLRGYEELHDSRYLTASSKAAQWEMSWPVNPNTNFNAFAIWHMAEHYRITGDAVVLESAVYKTRQGMYPSQQPSGGWPGHNSWSWYHGIILRAYAALYRVLPGDHGFGPTLLSATRAAVQYLISLQGSDGSLRANPGTPDTPSRWMAPQIAGLILADQCLSDPAIGTTLNGLVAYRISPDSGDPDIWSHAEQQTWRKDGRHTHLYALGMYLAECTSDVEPAQPHSACGA